MQTVAVITSSFSKSAFYAGLVGFGVFLLCLVGIASRPHPDLASFWPANAFLLGILVRFPSLANLATWSCAAAGFFAADALTGSDLQTNISLNVCNLAAIATGHRILSALPTADRTLQRPKSMLYLLRAILIAATVAGLVGMAVNPILFGGSWYEGFAFWFVTEMVNYAAFLPVLLTLPVMSGSGREILSRALQGWNLVQAKPLIALVLSAAASVLIGGPGAVAFPILALLWCALSYSLFTTACLTLSFGFWTLISIRTGIVWIGPDHDTRAFLLSTQLGVTFMSLAPLVVGSVMVARKDLLQQLRTLANTDVMTGLNNRRAFLEEGKALLLGAARDNQPIAVMMLDIDHFKSINDTHGHDAGDSVLVEFAVILKHNIRPCDKVGRLGGEEFAIILPGSDYEAAIHVAERINTVLRTSRMKLPSGADIPVTVSIGIHLDTASISLENLLSHADAALYRAKRTGRDRFVFSVAERDSFAELPKSA